MSAKGKTVLVGGCFDLIHYGHIYFLKQAKALGEKLVVLLESDETIRRVKNEGRPFHTQEQRAEMLESLSFVDQVVPLPPMKGDADYNALIANIRPDIICYTEGDPIAGKKIRQAAAIGAECIAIPKVHALSTSKLAGILGLE